jgi:ribosomal protein S18 acetylase RimI-like enzyme
MTVTFRAITDDDRDFLYQVYASTREEELRLTPWNAEEKAEFLRMQFQAQHKHYQEHYGDASYAIILLGETQIGRLYIHRGRSEIRILDIVLLSEYRGRGIGRRIMRDVLDEAQASGKAVRIHVEQNNPAMRLYERLGFKKLEDVGVYYLMEWLPAGQSDDLQ